MVAKIPPQPLNSNINRTPSPSRVELPPEILSEIFLTCLPVNSSWEESECPQRKDVLLFGQVSRYWRDVSLSTIRLWSVLNIDVRVRDMTREMDAAKGWLARSGVAPLSIKLSSHSESTTAHPIADVLLGHAPRLYMLALHAPQPIL